MNRTYCLTSAHLRSKQSLIIADKQVVNSCNIIQNTYIFFSYQILTAHVSLDATGLIILTYNQPWH